MIISQIKGGLGNQFFQYAVARYLSIKNNTELKLDISWYEKHHDREFKLSHFNILAKIASGFEVDGFKKYNKRFSFYKIVDSLKSFPNRKYLKERFVNYDESLLSAKDNVYLDGYWQSEKYFKLIEKEIRADFTLKENLPAESLELIRQINKTDSVSIHIRRGDYLSDKYSKVFPVCSIDYYHQAVGKILEFVPNPNFFIFSDDMDWVKNNLKINHPTHLASNGGFKDYEELVIMSKCKHNIIANSSFSWWSAWLNGNPDKIIIAPKKWTNNNPENMIDLIPETWIKL